MVAEARDGEEAVELARSQAPDLALLDVKMPKLDGIDAARRILEERPIPIVMVTAYGEQELVARAVEAGVFGYLVKPFRERDLLPAIATARARHEELTAVREEADSLAEALAARKAIERAKGLLMEREGLTEQDAFARLRKASQISGRPLQVVAEALIATLDALKVRGRARSYEAASSRSSSRRRRSRRARQTAAAKTTNGATATAMRERDAPPRRGSRPPGRALGRDASRVPAARRPRRYEARAGWSPRRASAAVAARLARSSRSCAGAWRGAARAAGASAARRRPVRAGR